MNGFYINLDKDADKRKTMEQKISEMGLPLVRFPAIYGKNVDKSILGDIFTSRYLSSVNDGIIGCALSHVSIWKKIVTDNLKDTIINEDDVVFSDDAMSQLQKLYSNLPPDYDIIYIGCSGVCGSRCTGMFGNQICKKYNDQLSIPLWATDGHGYILSNTGAKNSCKCIAHRYGL